MGSNIHQILGSNLVLELNFRTSLALLEEIKLKMTLYLLDAEGSWQMILPMQNLERAY